MSTEERAQYKELSDAVAGAFLAIVGVRRDEQIRDVVFGQYLEGGWYFEIKLASYRTIGNSKAARVDLGGSKDYSMENMKMVVSAVQGAFLREATPAIGQRP